MAKASARPRLGRPADSDSAATRRRIVECAQESFAARGFDGTTNKQIAASVGISTAALYHYFPSKVDMYVAVCEGINDTLTQAFTRASGAHTTLAERVRLLVEETGELGRRETSALVFITWMPHEVRNHPEVARGTERLQREFRALIGGIIRTAEDPTGLLEGTTLEGFADFVSSSLAGFARMSARGQHDRQHAAASALLRLIEGPPHK